ncbi:MAG: mechanosensitive ion channel domain-containing protein [Myxococcota bacterium]
MHPVSSRGSASVVDALTCLALACFVVTFTLGRVASAQPSGASPSAAAPAPSSDAVTGDTSVARIRRALDAIGGYDDVRVSRDADVVQLVGSVGQPGAREAAEQVASRAAPDALFVANAITVVAETAAAEGDSLAVDDVDREIEGTLRRVLGRVPELADVEVEVSGGIVHLRGQATAEAALKRAVAIAGEQEGALFVDNQVRVVVDLRDQVVGTLEGLQASAKKAVGKAPVFVIALIIIFLFGLLARGLTRVDWGKRLLPDRPLIRQVIRRVLATILFVVGCVLAFDLLGATGAVGALIGTAGVVGLAVGFAFKDIVENYLAGILLALHRPFQAGDLIELDGIQGKVIRLAARDTILMTLEGNHIQIPNAQVFKASMTNFTRNPLRRFDFTVGIGTGEKLSEAQVEGLGALQSMAGVLEEPAPFALVAGFGDSSMTVQFYGWVDQREADWRRVRSEAVRLVKRALDQANVDLPNPIYELDVYTEQGRRAKHVTAGPEEPAEAAVDIGVDHDIDRQIAEDEESEKSDLLATA